MSIHIKPSHKGLLHKKLGVPQGEKIPAGKLSSALHSPSPALRKEANFARNAKGWAHPGAAHHSYKPKVGGNEHHADMMSEAKHAWDHLK
jgi:hypothetical protein